MTAYHGVHSLMEGLHPGAKPPEPTMVGIGILIGSLTPGALVRLTINGGKVAKEERYLADLRERIRDVQQGPDGLLYLVTDNSSGRVILRLSQRMTAAPTTSPAASSTTAKR